MFDIYENKPSDNGLAGTHITVNHDVMAFSMPDINVNFYYKFC